MLDCNYIITIENKGWLKKNYLKGIDIPFAETDGLPIIGYGGTAGISYALFRLQADQVYIAGMDLYQTDYYYSEEAPKGVRKPMSERLILWKNYKKLIGKAAERVIPISGPLAELWQN